MGSPKDLRSFLRDVEVRAPHDLAYVDREVDSTLETAVLARRLGEVGRFPVLFFRKVRGSRFSLVSNVHADRNKMALALETDESRLVEEYIARLSRPVPPRIVADGPVKEVVLRGDDIDLGQLPIPVHCPKDAGRYITAGVGIVRDPDSGALNLGIYRHQVQGRAQLGIWLNPLFHGGDIFRRAERRGEPLQIAIVVGAHPALTIEAENCEPLGSDDYSLAGGLLGEPLALIAGECVSFPVPAWAEFVIEGVIPPHVRQEEGPFGEYPLTYGRPRPSPVVHVTAISHRRDAIWQDLNSAQQEHLCLWIVPAKEAGLLAKVRAVFPTVKAVHLPFSGAGYHAYVAIEKVREGDGKNVILAAMGAEPILKHVVAVDDDVDIFRDSEVLWAIATRVQAHQALFTVPGARTSPLDPSSYGLGGPYSGEGLVTKLGIDATRPLSVPFAERIGLTDEDRRTPLEDYLGHGSEAVQ
jgi:2,5-furandicarboxylate decarboxylase 1